MNIYCLWWYFCHIVTKFMFLPDNQLSNSAIQRYLYRLYNPFLTLKKRLNCIKSISTLSLSTWHPYRGKIHCKPLLYDCTRVCAARYYFQHVFCTCGFNEQRSLSIMPQIGTFWSPEQNCLANINTKLV